MHNLVFNSITIDSSISDLSRNISWTAVAPAGVNRIGHLRKSYTRIGQGKSDFGRSSCLGPAVGGIRQAPGTMLPEVRMSVGTVSMWLSFPVWSGMACLLYVVVSALPLLWVVRPETRAAPLKMEHVCGDPRVAILSVVWSSMPPG